MEKSNDMLRPVKAAIPEGEVVAWQDLAKLISRWRLEASVADMTGDDARSALFSGCAAELGELVEKLLAPPASERAEVVGVEAIKREAYKQGWNDREGDLIVAIDRIYPAPDQQAEPSSAPQSVSPAYQLAQPAAWAFEYLTQANSDDPSWEPGVSTQNPETWTGFGIRNIRPLAPIAHPATPGEEYATALRVLTDMDAEAMPLEKRAAILATMIARPTDADRAWAVSVAKDLPEVSTVEEEPNHVDDGKIRTFLLNWFAPWGSWKTAWWEMEVSDDAEMSDANALKHLRKLATKGAAV